MAGSNTLGMVLMIFLMAILGGICTYLYWYVFRRKPSEWDEQQRLEREKVRDEGAQLCEDHSNAYLWLVRNTKVEENLFKVWEENDCDPALFKYLFTFILSKDANVYLPSDFPKIQTRVYYSSGDPDCRGAKPFMRAFIKAVHEYKEYHSLEGLFLKYGMDSSGKDLPTRGLKSTSEMYYDESLSSVRLRQTMTLLDFQAKGYRRDRINQGVKELVKNKRPKIVESFE